MMPMIATTMSSSISEKPAWRLLFFISCSYSLDMIWGLAIFRANG
jgi:hypothetical protein